MDWIKVKVKHFEYDMADASDLVYKLWISAMIYTAAIEKMPTEAQISARIGPENLKKLRLYLKKTGVKLEHILGKVLEDVDQIKAKRRHNRMYYQTAERPLKDGCRMGKIREDKIREDKTSFFGVSSLKELSKNPEIKASLTKMGVKI